MTEVVHADIFFFITSLAVMLVTAGMLVLLYYLIPVARDIRDIVAKIRRAGESVEKDFDALRVNVREEGAKSKALVDLALGFIARKLRQPAARRPGGRKETSSPKE